MLPLLNKLCNFTSWIGSEQEYTIIGAALLLGTIINELIRQQAHRQAVAFMTANIAIELDGLRLITWRGASRAEQGLPFAREAALAKRLGTDKGMQIGLDGVQLLGGHGYTKEHPVERWYRDLRAIGVAEGVVVI